MANFFEGVWNALKHPIDEAEWMFNTTKDVLKGDMDLKDVPGSHQRMMNDITVPIFGDNKLSKNSDAVAGAVLGSIFAAPAIGSALGNAGIGGSEFATKPIGGGGNKFGNIDFSGSQFPSFEGGAPTDTGGLTLPDGKTPEGGWKESVKWGEFDGSGTNWKEVGNVVSDALKDMEDKREYKVSSSGVRPGFRKVQDTGLQATLVNDWSKQAFGQSSMLATTPQNPQLQQLFKQLQ